MNLTVYANNRDRLLDRIVQTLEADSRVEAVWLSGSFGRGEADAWSDLDLHVAVADHLLVQFLDEREALYRRVGRPLLIQDDMPSNSQTGARFQLVQYAGLIEVDWNIGPTGQARCPLAFQMLFQRTTIPTVALPALTTQERQEQADRWLTFFWTMAPIAIKYCGRGDTRRAVSQIDLLSAAFVALWRLVSQPAGPDPVLPGINRVLERELEAVLPHVGSLINPHTALDVVWELYREVEGLHFALAAIGAAIPQSIQEEIETLYRIADDNCRRTLS